MAEWQDLGETSNSRALVPVDQNPPKIIRIPLPLPVKRSRPAPLTVVRDPRRDPNLVSDVLVPGAQAVAAMVAMGIGTGLVAAVFGWSWKVPVLILACTLVLSWFARQRFADATIWRVESSYDPDPDPAVTLPLEQKQHDFVVANAEQAREEVARDVQQQTLSTERADLIAFVDKCLTLRSTSETTHGVKAGGPDRDAYIRKRDVLIKLGIAQWRNPDRPTAGWEIVVSRQRARDLILKHIL